MGKTNFSGNAVETTLVGPITNAALIIDVVNAGSYPSTNFVIVLGHDTPAEEKVFVGARSGNQFTNCIRGFDGTAQAAHIAGVTVNHCLSAEWCQRVDNAINVGTDAGDMAYYTAAGILARRAIGTPGQYMRVNAAGNAPEWTSLVSRGNWTPHLPTMNIGSGVNALNVAEYTLIGGSLMIAKGKISFGTGFTAPAGMLTFGLPTGWTFAGTDYGEPIGQVVFSDVGNWSKPGEVVRASTNFAAFIAWLAEGFPYVVRTGVNDVNPQVWAEGDGMSWAFQADVIPG